MNDAPACRCVDHYHAGRGARGSEARPPPIAPITHNQEDQQTLVQQTAASAKKAPKEPVPHEFPPCCFEAPTAGPCTPYPRCPSPRCAHEYSAERIGTAPVAIDAVIRRRYGTPRTERRRRPLRPREVAESCPRTLSTRRRRWEVGRIDPAAMVSARLRALGK